MHRQEFSPWPGLNTTNFGWRCLGIWTCCREIPKNGRFTALRHMHTHPNIHKPCKDHRRQGSRVMPCWKTGVLSRISLKNIIHPGKSQGWIRSHSENRVILRPFQDVRHHARVKRTSLDISRISRFAFKPWVQHSAGPAPALQTKGIQMHCGTVFFVHNFYAAQGNIDHGVQEESRLYHTLSE